MKSVLIAILIMVVALGIGKLLQDELDYRSSKAASETAAAELNAVLHNNWLENAIEDEARTAIQFLQVYDSVLSSTTVPADEESGKQYTLRMIGHTRDFLKCIGSSFNSNTHYAEALDSAHVNILFAEYTASIWDSVGASTANVKDVSVAHVNAEFEIQWFKHAVNGYLRIAKAEQLLAPRT